MSLKRAIQSSRADRLQSMVRLGGNRHLVYTRLADDTFHVRATDGAAVWDMTVNSDKLDELTTHSGMENTKAYLDVLRTEFPDMTLSRSSFGLTLASIGTPSLSFTMYEMKSGEMREEVQRLFLRFAERCVEMDRVTAVAAATGDAASSAAQDMEDKNKPSSKKAGMSVINPSSRKRKAPQGVVYD